MEKEQIIKALECCTRGRKSKDDRPCLECPYNECNIVGGTSERQTSGTCQGWLMKDALALIKQQDEQIFQLENRLKECENGYAGTLHLESCKLHDAEEKVKELTQANDMISESYDHLEKTKDNLLAERARLTEENERLRKLATVKEVEKEIVRKETRADTARKMQERLKEKIHKSVYQYWNDGGGGYYLAEDVDDDIDQIAKEMLEGE